MAGLDDFQERRFMGALQALVALLRAHSEEKWANWFEEDLADYRAAQGLAAQGRVARQRAVVEHVLMTFGGMSTFTQLTLTGEAGESRPEANERLQFLSTQLWAAARGLQGILASEEQ
jgi:hypothetical protein